jgi:hypothetical protein
MKRIFMQFCRASEESVEDRVFAFDISFEQYNR